MKLAHSSILVPLDLASPSLTGPESYVSAAPQPAGLLCNPELDLPAITASQLIRDPSGQR
jgi:hypothetical protein